MRPCSPRRPLLVVSALLPAFGAVAADGDMPLTHASTNLNRFSLNARFGMNISAKFKSVATPPATAIGGTGSALDHYYQDGYVRVDGSGNAGGTTWFWGYDNASQVSGNSILFHSTAGTDAGSTGDIKDDPQLGVELVYNRQFGTFGRDIRWGLEAGFGWSPISISDRGAISGGMARITDAYAFTPGTTPPAAGHAGTFAGPGFEISDTPVRSSAAIAGSTLTGSRELDADLLALRLGPSLEFPIGRHCLLGVSGGLAVGYVQSDYTWSQTAPGGPTLRGSGSDDDVQWGGFIGATFTYAFNEHWSVDAGAQFMTLGRYTHESQGAKAELDLSKMVWFSVGLGYSF